MSKKVSEHIENFRLDLAIDQAYHFVWDRFASEIIEQSKPIFSSNEKFAKESRQQTIYQILIISLKALHPFMPFITESIWQCLPEKDSPLLLVSKMQD